MEQFEKLKQFILFKPISECSQVNNQYRILDTAWYSNFNPLIGESFNYYVDENFKVHAKGSYLSESNETIYDNIWIEYDDIIGDYITSEDDPTKFINENSVVKFGDNPQLSFALDIDEVKERKDITYIQLENQYFEKIKNPGIPGEDFEYYWKLGDVK